jgi:3-deoxy-D-manno-octulosonate 8-phosphate phosphatase KdsC-like HAD superfamily phosphatase
MTDWIISYIDTGQAVNFFDAHAGLALKYWKKAGHPSDITSARAIPGLEQ